MVTKLCGVLFKLVRSEQPEPARGAFCSPSQMDTLTCTFVICPFVNRSTLCTYECCLSELSHNCAL